MDWGPEWNLDELLEEDRRRRRAGRPGIKEDRALWVATSPGVTGGLTTMESIENEAAAMSVRQFGRERLGCWPKRPPVEQERQRPIPESLWVAAGDGDAAGDPQVAPEVVAFGVDADPGRVKGAITAYGIRPDGLGGLLEVVEHRPGIAWIPARLRELRDAHDPLGVVVCGKGPCASIVQAIRDEGFTEPREREPDYDGKRPPHRGDLLVTGLAEDAVATAQFIDAVRAHQPAAVVAPGDDQPAPVVPLWHLDDPELNRAVEGAELRDIGDGQQTWGRRSSTAGICTLFAGTMARFLYEQWAPVLLVEREWDPVGNIR
jgi:hypothetical protein